jgi:hypothetical protein
MSTFVCITCATTTDAAGACATCGEERLDLARDDVRTLCDDIDSRRRRAREQQVLWGAIVAAMVLVVAMSMIPAWWWLRRMFFALPFFLDQIILMAVVAALLHKLALRVFAAKPRFPAAPG